MAEEPEEEEEDWETDDGEEEEMFDDSVLRGFRFFWNNLNGDEHEQEDNDDENAEEEEEEEEEEEQEDTANVPTTDFVAQKLREQGVTFEQLVHMMCNLDHDEYRESEQAERFGDELFGKIRIIVSNYTPEQAASSTQPSPEQTSAPVAVPVEAPVNVDFDAQPKIYSRRMMIHV